MHGLQPGKEENGLTVCACGVVGTRNQRKGNLSGVAIRRGQDQPDGYGKLADKT